MYALCTSFGTDLVLRLPVFAPALYKTFRGALSEISVGRSSKESGLNFSPSSWGRGCGLTLQFF